MANILPTQNHIDPLANTGKVSARGTCGAEISTTAIIIRLVTRVLRSLAWVAFSTVIGLIVSLTILLYAVRVIVEIYKDDKLDDTYSPSE